jgi:hypothetical protein
VVALVNVNDVNDVNDVDDANDANDVNSAKSAKSANRLRNTGSPWLRPLFVDLARVVVRPLRASP